MVKKQRPGSVSVIKTNHAVVLGNATKKARPTILLPLNTNRSRQKRSDYVKEKRRTHLFPGPSLVNENAIFVADRSDKTPTVTTFDSMAFQFKRKSEATDFPSKLEITQSQISSEAVKPHSPQNNADREEDQVFVFDEKASSTNLTKDSLLEENSFSSTRAYSTSSSKRDFTKTFHFDSKNEPAYNTCDQYGQKIQEPVLWISDSGHDINSESNVSYANGKEENEQKDIPNISYEKTSDDKATISISIPTSILKDQKHFQTVMNTIKNALIKHDPTEKEETKDEETGCHDYKGYQMQNAITQCRPEVSPDQSSQWQNVSQDSYIHHTGERSRERYHSTPSTQCSTSGASKTRKRAFTAESLERREASSWDVEDHQPLQFNASSDNTYSSKAEGEWMPRSQIAAEDEIWNSEINDMLEAAMDKIPIVYSKEADVSTRGLLETYSDQGTRRT